MGSREAMRFQTVLPVVVTGHSKGGFGLDPKVRARKTKCLVRTGTVFYPLKSRIPLLRKSSLFPFFSIRRQFELTQGTCQLIVFVLADIERTSRITAV
jgi:hypothetical protein